MRTYVPTENFDEKKEEEEAERAAAEGAREGCCAGSQFTGKRQKRMTAEGSRVGTF